MVGRRRSGRRASTAAQKAAVSRTVRVRTPSLMMLTGIVVALADLAIRPRVALSPTSPQAAAGIRIEPPPSLPCAIGTTPAATSAAAPPDDAPGENAGAHRSEERRVGKEGRAQWD